MCAFHKRQQELDVNGLCVQTLKLSTVKKTKTVFNPDISTLQVNRSSCGKCAMAIKSHYFPEETYNLLRKYERARQQNMNLCQ